MWRSRVLYLTVFAAAALLTVAYDDMNVGLTIMYAQVLYFVVSLASALAAPFVIRLSEHVEQNAVFKTETLSYTFRVRNKSPFFYPRARCEYLGSSLAAFDRDVPDTCVLRPGADVMEECGVMFQYRGIYSLGVEKITVTDLFGLFRRTVRNRNPLTITVFPRRDGEFALPVNNEPSGNISGGELSGEDFSSVADLREYTSADPLRKIHWKLSAGRGKLIVKHYQSFEPDQTLLLLDTRDTGLEEPLKSEFEDLMICRVAAAVDACAGAQLPAELIYGENGSSRVSVSPSHDLGGAYTLLAEIEFDGERSMLPSLEPGSYPCNLAVFFFDFDGSVCASLCDLASLGHNITAYCFYCDELPLPEPVELLRSRLLSEGISFTAVEV